MTYRVDLGAQAERQLGALPREAARRVVEAMRALGGVPRPLDTRKLKAREGYRIRVGHYRVLYTVDDRAGVVRVYRLGHRREVYR